MGSGIAYFHPPGSINLDAPTEILEALATSETDYTWIGIEDLVLTLPTSFVTLVVVRPR